MIFRGVFMNKIDSLLGLGHFLKSQFKNQANVLVHKLSQDFEEGLHRNVVKYISAKLMGSFVISLFFKYSFRCINVI